MEEITQLPLIININEMEVCVFVFFEKSCMNSSFNCLVHFNITGKIPPVQSCSFLCDSDKFHKLYKEVHTFSPSPPCSFRYLPQVLQCGHCQHATEQQQCKGVGVQQQGTSQALQCVKGQQAKGFFTQIQTGVKIPAGGEVIGRERRGKEEGM